MGMKYQETIKSEHIHNKHNSEINMAVSVNISVIVYGCTMLFFASHSFRVQVISFIKLANL